MSDAIKTATTLVLHGRVDRLDQDTPDYHAAVARLERCGIGLVVARGEIHLDHVKRLSFDHVRDQLKKATQALNRLAEARGADFSVTLDSVNTGEAEARRLAEAGELATMTFAPSRAPATD